MPKPLFVARYLVLDNEGWVDVSPEDATHIGINSNVADHPVPDELIEAFVIEDAAQVHQILAQLNGVVSEFLETRDGP